MLLIKPPPRVKVSKTDMGWEWDCSACGPGLPMEHQPEAYEYGKNHYVSCHIMSEHMESPLGFLGWF